MPYSKQTLISQVAQGNFPLTLSQIPAWISRFTGLLLLSRWFNVKLPMSGPCSLFRPLFPRQRASCLYYIFDFGAVQVCEHWLPKTRKDRYASLISHQNPWNLELIFVQNFWLFRVAFLQNFYSFLYVTIAIFLLAAMILNSWKNWHHFSRNSFSIQLLIRLCVVLRKTYRNSQAAA